MAKTFRIVTATGLDTKRFITEAFQIDQEQVREVGLLSHPVTFEMELEHLSK
jgi:hypothetical protein